MYNNTYHFNTAYILILERLASNNLIDLNCEAPPPPAQNLAHNYVNDFVVGNKNQNCQQHDVFDMRMLLLKIV